MSLPPIPAASEIVASVRESCRTLRVATDIPVDHEAIKRLLMSPVFQETFPKLKIVHGLTIPLQFGSTVSELSYLGILALLNCGSGYRAPLYAVTGRGTYNNIQALLMSLYLSSSEGNSPSNYLSAKGMQSLTRETIAEMLNVSLHVEKAHPTIPGLTVGELGGSLLGLTELLAGLLNDTGKVLQQGGYPDLGTFLAEALNEAKKEGEKVGKKPLASVVLHKVVSAFPGFQDMGYHDGKAVYVFKKALFLVHSIAARFGDRTGSVPVPDTDDLPIFCDNVIPSMMVHLGVLDLSHAQVPSTLQTLFPSTTQMDTSALLALTPAEKRSGAKSETKEPVVDGPILSQNDALVLRAAAIDQCEEIVKYARTLEILEDKAGLKTMTAVELDAWLWAVAKDVPEFRELPRYVLRPTPWF